MLKKASMLSISVLLTIIVFIATTAVQRFFVKFEPVVKVLVAAQEIQANRPIDRFMFKTAEVPINLVMNMKVVKNFEDIKEHYAVEPIHAGEILLDQAIALKNEVKIIEAEKGKEKVSVKLKAPEHAVSYQIRTGDKVNLYFTGKYGIIKKLDNQTATAEVSYNNNYDYTVRLLENIRILGVFDENGNALNNTTRDVKVDTVIFEVSPDMARTINNLRGQGTFDITGLPYAD